MGVVASWDVKVKDRIIQSRAMMTYGVDAAEREVSNIGSAMPHADLAPEEYRTVRDALNAITDSLNKIKAIQRLYL